MNITHTHIFILICILQVLDVVTTLYCLRKGIGTEANPVMRKLGRGRREACAVGMKALVIGVTASSMTTTDTTSLWVLAAISAVVVINNALVIDRSRN